MTFTRFMQTKVAQSPIVVDVRRALLNVANEPTTPQDVIDALHRYYATTCAKRRYSIDDAVLDLWRSYQRCLRASEAA